MKIDCTRCEMYQSENCEDCLVSALLHPPADEIEISDDLGPPLRALGEAGLVPVLKFCPRGPSGADPPENSAIGHAG